jgi:hypothetical protein
MAGGKPRIWCSSQFLRLEILPLPCEYRQPSLSAVNWFQKNRALSETALTELHRKVSVQKLKISNIILHYCGFRQERYSEAVLSEAHIHIFINELRWSNQEHFQTNSVIHSVNSKMWTICTDQSLTLKRAHDILESEYLIVYHLVPKVIWMKRHILKWHWKCT